LLIIEIDIAPEKASIVLSVLLSLNFTISEEGSSLVSIFLDVVLSYVISYLIIPSLICFFEIISPHDENRKTKIPEATNARIYLIFAF
jgi:hypothetical protein